MSIEELENMHYNVFDDRGIGNPLIKHTKLSIEFAISVLEEMRDTTIHNRVKVETDKKIQELKTYLKDG